MNKKNSSSEVFAGRLRSARELRGLKQNELADQAGIPPSSVAHFEGGSRKPSFDSLRRLSNALEVTTDYLLGRVDDPVLAEQGDPLFRDASKLSDADRELAKDFMRMLRERSSAKEDVDNDE
uniref:Helix-turn-helix n=1 Tax=Candidatus Kentrum sp. FW TaxID=2126338 RepID=A0A450TYU8_9GAMM|nr:MAG: Helix-turn-helix [Candidatus Kentron sp. FW]